MRTALCAQSKSQKSERMKKMMKKFLSSLLALTMILSLVIVPANAAAGDTIDGVSVSSSNVTLTKLGDTTDVTFTVPKNLTVGDTVTVNSKEVMYNGKLSHSIASSNNNIAICSQNGNTVTITAVGYGETTITYTVSFNYLDNGTSATATQTLTTKVTVEPEEPADTYTVSKPVITVKANDKVTKETSFPIGTALSFSVAAPTVTKNGETMNSSDYTLEYIWTGATAGKDTSTATATPDKSGPLNVTCTVNVKVDGKKVVEDTSATTKLTITDPQDAFDKATKTVTYKGRSYQVKDNSVTIDLFGSETIANADLAVSATGVAVEKGTFTAAEGNNDATLVIKSKDNSELTVTVTLRTNAVKNAKVNIKKDNKVVTEPIEIVTGQEISLTPAYDKGNATVSKPTYKWKLNTGNEVEGSSYKFSEKTDGDYTITCNVYEGTSSVVAASKEVTVKVGKDTRYPYAANNDKEKYTLASGDSQTLTDPVLKDKDGKV